MRSGIIKYYVGSFFDKEEGRDLSKKERSFDSASGLMDAGKLRVTKAYRQVDCITEWDFIHQRVEKIRATYLMHAELPKSKPFIALPLENVDLPVEELVRRIQAAAGASHCAIIRGHLESEKFWEAARECFKKLLQDL